MNSKYSSKSNSNILGVPPTQASTTHLHNSNQHPDRPPSSQLDIRNIEAAVFNEKD